MDTVFENKTQYNGKLLMKYYLNAVNNSIFNYSILLIIILLAGFEFFAFYITKDLNALLIGFGYLLSILIIFFMNKTIVKFKLKKFVLEQDIMDYKFYEKHLTVNDKKIKYKDVNKVKFNGKSAYLYTKKNLTLIIELDKFIKGNSERFKLFSKKHIK